jgi:hypothetical protein
MLMQGGLQQIRICVRMHFKRQEAYFYGLLGLTVRRRPKKQKK